MEQFWKKIVAINERFNHLPHKVFLSLLVIAAFFLCVAVFPYIWPFVLGVLFAMLIEPLVRLLRKAFKKLPFGKSVATGISMIILFGLLSWLLIYVLGKLFVEVRNFAVELPNMVAWLNIKVQELLNAIAMEIDGKVSEDVLAFISNIINELGKSLLSLAGSLSKSIASGAWTTATSFPMILLSVLFAIMSTFYFSSDKERIFAFFRKAFPQQTVNNTKKLKDNVFKALGAQVKAQLLISCLLVVFLIIGLSIIGISYPFLIGLIIGLADALPVIGAGLFLIPWSIFGFISGNTSLGIGMAILYVALGIFRQIIEPRIVGKSLGLHPLTTMMSIFIGFKVTGSFLGMLAGPIMLNICRVVLELDEEVRKKSALEAGIVIKDGSNNSLPAEIEGSNGTEGAEQNKENPTGALSKKKGKAFQKNILKKK